MTINTTSRQPGDWLRLVLNNALEAAPIQEYAKRETQRFVHQSPDRLLLHWCQVNGVDASEACRSAPLLPEMFLSDRGRTYLKQYVETYRARPVVQRLRRLISVVDRLDTNGGIPCEYSKVVHAIAAVALGNRTADGREFLARVASVLGTSAHPDEILTAYECLLTNAKAKLSQVHDMLDCEYGRWVVTRLEEALELLRIYQPEFHIRQGERSALWDALWVAIFTGGDEK